MKHCPLIEFFYMLQIITSFFSLCLQYSYLAAAYYAIQQLGATFILSFAENYLYSFNLGIRERGGALSDRLRDSKGLHIYSCL